MTITIVTSHIRLQASPEDGEEKEEEDENEEEQAEDDDVEDDDDYLQVHLWH